MLDNTNWRAGRAGGPCFQMKNVNIGGLLIRQRAGPVRRDAQKGGPAGFSAARRPRLCVQLTGPLCCAACRPALLCSLFSAWSSVQPAENSCYSFGNTALLPAGPPFSVIREFLSEQIEKLYYGRGIEKE